MKRLLFYIVVLSCLLASCKPNTPRPTPQVQQFDYGRVIRYGAFYAEGGLENNVYELDIYSPGLKLNWQGYIEGSGYNLCFSDVFTLPTDSVLQEGVTYQADSTGRADSFLPGKDYEGNINGAYLLDITDGQINSITLFKNGTFVLTNHGDTTDITFELVTTSNTVYKASFHAPLYYKKQK